MNKVIVVLVLGVVLCVGGCSAKQDRGSAPGAQNAGSRNPMQPLAAHGEANQANPAVNPHVNMNRQDMTGGADHRGKVVSTMNASGYTYMEVEENGKKFWIATMEVAVKPGDDVVFPDSPPVENFHSKTLNRTFDRIILAPSVQVNGKPGEMGRHPRTS